MSLGHVYIVLELVGSARLTFDDDFVLYELCDLVTESHNSYNTISSSNVKHADPTGSRTM